MSLEEIAVDAGHKVFMELNLYSIVSHPQGFLDQQWKPQPINLLNITAILINYIKCY